MAYRLGFGESGYPPGAVRYERDGELCVAGDDRFILANIELPVAGGTGDERFVWTAWVSLSRATFELMDARWEGPDREYLEPAFGWLSSAIPTYTPTTQNLRTRVHTRAVGLRPIVELEPTDHPLAVEQRDGVTRDRIEAVYHVFLAG